MVEPYLDVLRAGGSKPPEELAEIVGLDLTDAGIWASGIEAPSAELDEAETRRTKLVSIRRPPKSLALHAFSRYSRD